MTTPKEFGNPVYIIRGWCVPVNQSSPIWVYLSRNSKYSVAISPHLQDALRFADQSYAKSLLPRCESHHVNDPKVVELVVKEESTDSTVSRSVVV